MVDIAGPVEFRRFALAVYDTDGVPAACLLLQDRFDADVDLVLFAAFLGAAQGQTETGPILQKAYSRVNEWHREVVRPLRRVRQRLKTGPAPAPGQTTAALRQKIHELEIEAELVEMDQLGALRHPPRDLDGAADGAVERATAAMRTALRHYSDRRLEDAEDQALAAIAEAAARHTAVNR